MKAHANQLALKRLDLQMRCALQRQQVAQLGNHIEARLASVDRVISLTMSATNRPILLLAALAGTLLAGPWRIVRWASHGAMLFTAARKVQQLLANK